MFFYNAFLEGNVSLSFASEERKTQEKNYRDSEIIKESKWNAFVTENENKGNVMNILEFNLCDYC